MKRFTNVTEHLLEVFLLHLQVYWLVLSIWGCPKFWLICKLCHSFYRLNERNTSLLAWNRFLWTLWYYDMHIGGWSYLILIHLPVYMIVVSVFCLRGLKVGTMGSGVPSMASTTLILVRVITRARSVTSVRAVYTLMSRILYPVLHSFYDFTLRSSFSCGVKVNLSPCLFSACNKKQ